MQMYDSQESVPKGKSIRVFLQGAGAALPTLLLAQGLSIARPGVGQTVITWVEDPGAFLGFGYAFGDNTSTANVKGWSAVRTAYSNTNGIYTIEVDVFNSSFAAADLAATSFIDLEFNFSWSSGR